MHYTVDLISIAASLNSVPKLPNSSRVARGLDMDGDPRVSGQRTLPESCFRALLSSFLRMAPFNGDRLAQLVSSRD